MNDYRYMDIFIVVLIICPSLLLFPLQELMEKCYSFRLSKIRKHLMGLHWSDN